MLEWVTENPFAATMLAAVAAWIGLSFFGPLVSYGYRRSITVRAPRTTVWQAIDMFAPDHVPLLPGTRIEPVRPGVVRHGPGDGAIAFAYESERLAMTPGMHLSHRPARLIRGSKPHIIEAPHGEDAFESVTLTELSPEATRVDFSSRIGFSDPLRALIHHISVAGYLAALRRFCENGGERAPAAGKTRLSGKAKLTRALLFLSALLAASVLFGPVAGLMILAVLYVHEAGHAIAFRLVGERFHGIDFVPFLGAVTRGSPPKTAMRSAIVALGGVMFSWPVIILLIVLPSLLGYELRAGRLVGASFAALEPASVCYMLAAWGIVLNCLQLLPVPFLDGGRILEAMLSGFGRRPIIVVLAVLGVGTGAGLLLSESYLFAAFTLALSLLSLHLLKYVAEPPFAPASRLAAFGIFGMYAGQIALYAFALGFLFFMAGIGVQQADGGDGLVRDRFERSDRMFENTQGDPLSGTAGSLPTNMVAPE